MPEEVGGGGKKKRGRHDVSSMGAEDDGEADAFYTQAVELGRSKKSARKDKCAACQTFHASLCPWWWSSGQEFLQSGIALQRHCHIRERVMQSASIASNTRVPACCAQHLWSFFAGTQQHHRSLQWQIRLWKELGL